MMKKDNSYMKFFGIVLSVNSHLKKYIWEVWCIGHLLFLYANFEQLYMGKEWA